MISFVPLNQIPPDAVDSLLDRAFGLDRHLRTAYKIRDNAQTISALSFAALTDTGALAGTIQCWPIALHCDDGSEVPLTMVGPVAVDPDLQQGGIGRALMEHMLAAVPGCDDAGCQSLMLIGDPEYYSRFFGFSPNKTSKWRAPGPFEARRMLALGDDAPDCSGMLGPRSTPDA